MGDPEAMTLQREEPAGLAASAHGADLPQPVAPVYLHVGLFKAASTTLQRYLFPRHSELLYLRESNKRIEDLTYLLMKADSTYFDVEPVRREMWSLLGASPPAGKKWLLSINNIMTYEARDKGLAAERLKAVFPTGRIIVMLRRQEDLVQSWYLQKLEHLIPIDEYLPFEAWAAQALSKRYKSVFDDLDYAPIIECYERLFGRENLCLLLFEEFARDQERWLKRFTDFTGIGLEETRRLLSGRHANPRVSKRMLAYGYVRTNFVPRAVTKVVRRVVPKPLQARWYEFWKGGTPVPKGLPPRWAEEVRAHAAPGNARLAAKYGLPLEDYGYSLP